MKNKINYLLALCFFSITTVFAQTGSVGINTANPDASAVLDVFSTNKGILAPRIPLESNTDQITISNPATGLLVFNTGAAGLKFIGYVYWSGSEWKALNNSSLYSGTVGAITCNSVKLVQSTYTSGVPYTGTMNVPYTGGNGGTYTAQTIGPVNGLSATLSAGNFNSGAGSLSYTISGTPTVTSPTTTTFPISIGGKSCNAVVGSGDEIGLGELVYYHTSLSAGVTGWLSAYTTDLPILGGKLRLDAYFYHDSNRGNNDVSMNPALVNTSSSAVKFWFSALTTVNRYNAGNYLLAPSTPSGSGALLAPSAYVYLDDGIYYGVGYNDMIGITTPRIMGYGDSGNQEVLTMDLQLDSKWYRVYYFPTVDNKNTTSTTDNTREIYLSIQRLY